MAYTPNVYADNPSGNTPITAAKLNGLEQAVGTATTAIYRPEEYGSVGDGTTDDTTPFASAWNAAKTANGTLVLTKNYGVKSIPSARAGMKIVGTQGAPLYGSQASNQPRVTLLSGFTGTAALTNDGTVGGFIVVTGVNWDASALGFGTSVKGWYAPGGGSNEPNWVVKDCNFFDFGGSVELGTTSPVVVECERVSAFYGQSHDGFKLNVYDSTFIDCLAQGSQYGWHVTGAPASKFIGCRSEHNSLYGWYFDATIVTTDITLIGCSTDQNDRDGCVISGATWGFTKGGAIKLTACSFGRDGNNSGSGSSTYAGLRLLNNTVPIQISGVNVASARGDSSGYGPAYGLVVSGNTAPINIDGGGYGGTIASISDDLTSSSVQYGPSIQRYTRSSSAETVTFTTMTTGLSLVATTGVGGFALQNGTPNIVTWTAPNDGQMHRVLFFCAINVGSTAETGGLVQDSITLPNNSTVVQTVFGANQGGFTAVVTFLGGIVGPGKTASINQTTALTGGSATVWVEAWAL